MSRPEDLINLNENSSTPPPVYNGFNVNQSRVNLNQTPISHHQNGHMYPNFPTQQPQAPVQPQYIPIQPNQIVMPLIDINKLPLSMQRNYYIQNNYPTSYVIFHCVCLLMLGLTMIAAEIFVLYKVDNSFSSANQMAGNIFPILNKKD